jgi:hypothetical protein
LDKFDATAVQRIGSDSSESSDSDDLDMPTPRHYRPLRIETYYIADHSTESAADFFLRLPDFILFFVFPLLGRLIPSSEVLQFLVFITFLTPPPRLDAAALKHIILQIILLTLPDFWKSNKEN